MTTMFELPLDRPADGPLGLAERGLLHDAVVRAGIRRLCAQRLQEEYAGGVSAQSERLGQRLQELRRGVVANAHSSSSGAEKFVTTLTRSFAAAS